MIFTEARSAPAAVADSVTTHAARPDPSAATHPAPDAKPIAPTARRPVGVGSRTREYRECAAIWVSVTMMHHDSQSHSWHFSCQVFTVNGVGIPALLDLWKGGLHGLHPSCTECHCPKAHLVTCRLDPRKRVRTADSVDGERIRPRHGRYSRDRRPLRSHRGPRTRFVRVPAELGNSAAQRPGEPRNGAIAATSTPRDLVPTNRDPARTIRAGFAHFTDLRTGFPAFGSSTPRPVPVPTASVRRDNTVVLGELSPHARITVPTVPSRSAPAHRCVRCIHARRADIDRETGLTECRNDTETSRFGIDVVGAPRHRSEHDRHDPVLARTPPRHRRSTVLAAAGPVAA